MGAPGLWDGRGSRPGQDPAERQDRKERALSPSQQPGHGGQQAGSCAGRALELGTKPLTTPASCSLPGHRASFLPQQGAGGREGGDRQQPAPGCAPPVTESAPSRPRSLGADGTQGRDVQPSPY